MNTSSTQLVIAVGDSVHFPIDSDWYRPGVVLCVEPDFVNVGFESFVMRWSLCDFLETWECYERVLIPTCPGIRVAGRCI